MELEFRFTDVTSRIALHNLFENNYHLNVHFYNLRNYASFTLMQTEGTIIPKPCLTEYIKLVTKGIIKRTNLPFEFTIAFEC